MQAFINAGYNPTARSYAGKSPLEIAIQCRFTSVVELLVSSGAHLPPDALLIAVLQGSTLEMVECLIQRGADHSTMFCGDTLLHLALRTPYSDEKRCKLVKRLIDAGCDTTIHDSSGQTVLEVALYGDSTSIIEVLLSSGVPFPPDALLIATQEGLTLETVESLIYRGANVHSATLSGDTALHFALWNYSEEMCCKIVKRLINAGCDTAACNSIGETALEIAIQYGLISVIQLLLSSNVPLPPDTLLMAVGQGSVMRSITLALYRTEEECYKLVQFLINAGCNPSVCNSEGNTVLLTAIKHGYSSVVELLLSCNVHIPPDILHTASRHHCKPQILEMLTRKLDDSDYLQIASGSDCDRGTQLQLATTFSGQCSQQVAEILTAVPSKGCRSRRSLEDETYMHVAKRPRLDEWEQPSMPESCT